ncbi:MAG: MMPL family transporter [Planctomycetes bacterium]|nr:MMPL family transporter [Planctomycetota bacterium]
MEFLLRRIAHFIISYHKYIFITFFVLTVTSVITIVKMEINPDIIDVLPSNNAVVARFKDFIETFETMDNVTCIIESNDNRIYDHIDMIENFAKRLNDSPLFDYVDHSPIQHKSDLFLKRFPLFLDEKGLNHLEKRLMPIGIERQIRQNRRKLFEPINTPMDYELISKDPLNMRGLVMDSLMKSRGDEGLDLSSGYYFTKDYSAAFIFAKPGGRSRDMAFVKKLKKFLDSSVLRAIKESSDSTDVQIGITGACILSEEVRRIILHDIISSSALSVVLIALLIWLVYRVRPWILVIIGFTMLASLSMTLSFAYLVFGSLNAVTSIVTAVLIGLYVDYSMHTVKRFSDEFKRHNDKLLALEATLTKTGSAIIISGATTSLSFFSIVVTNFRGLFELGIVAGIGVILCLISTLFLLNSMLVWLSSYGLHKILYKKDISCGVESLAGFVLKYPGYIMIMVIVFVLSAGYGMSMLTFDNNPDNLSTRGSPAINVGEIIGEKLGKKGEPLNIIINAKDEEGLLAAFDTLETELHQWEMAGLIGSYHSLGMLVPAPSVQSLRISKLKELWAGEGLRMDVMEQTLTMALKKNNFVYDDGFIKKYLGGILNAVNNTNLIGLNEIDTSATSSVNHFFNKDEFSIAAYLYPTGKEWDRHNIDAIKEYVRQKGENWILLGKHVLFAEIKTSIICGSSLATILALLVNFVIIYLYFRKMIYVTMVFLPVTIGFVLTMGIMGLSNIPFNHINIGTVALIAGLGVDYGIYVTQAYIKDGKADIGNTLRVSGKNVMMCALTTVAGCGSLVLAQFDGVASIGSVLSIGAITCAFAALVVVPAIICLRENRRCAR